MFPRYLANAVGVFSVKSKLNRAGTRCCVVPYLMENFSYTAPAELFVSTSFRRNSHIEYQRFDRAADAIRYAIESLLPKLLAGTVLEVGEERFDSAAIRALYDHAAYPLDRTS